MATLEAEGSSVEQDLGTVGERERAVAQVLALLVVLLGLLLDSATVGLEGLDLLLDRGLALGKGAAVDLVLEALRLPVLGLLGGLEDGVLTDGSVGVGEDLLNVF